MANVENIEEVVLAVENQDDTVALLEEVFGLEFKESWSVPVDSMKVRCARVGSTQFHVVASTDEEGVIARFIKDKGEGIHHVAFKVDNLDETVQILKRRGLKLVPPEPREAQREGYLVKYIFVHPRSAHGILIELVEKRTTPGS